MSGKGCLCDRFGRRMEEELSPAPPPLADWYLSPAMTLPREPEQPTVVQALVPYAPRMPKREDVGPADRADVLTIGRAYARRLLRIIPATPVTEWQRATGYSTIASRQVEPLAAPRYTFAALDTEALVDEAYGR